MSGRRLLVITTTVLMLATTSVLTTALLPNGETDADTYRSPLAAAPSSGGGTESKLGLSFLALDQPLQRAFDALGEPRSTGPDLGGTARHWTLAPGAELTVTATDDSRVIVGLLARVNPSASAPVPTFGGVLVGQSTLLDVVKAWGTSLTPSVAPEDDYVIRYIECVGPYPVVIKFDQAAATAVDYSPVAGSTLWTQPVTSLLIAYADAEPGSAGCGDLSTQV